MTEMNAPAPPAEIAAPPRAPETAVAAQVIEAPALEPPVEDPEVVTLDAWALHAGVHVAHANHIRALNKLDKDFKARPEHFAGLHEAMKKERI